MRKILTGLMLMASFVTFSQSNNIDFSMTFVNNPAFASGLDEISRKGDIFQISVSINQNDLNLLGALTILIYDSSTSSLIFGTTIDRQQVLSGTYTDNGMLVFSFPYMNPKGNYQVVLDVQNTQQAYFPRIEKKFPTN